MIKSFVDLSYGQPNLRVRLTSSNCMNNAVEEKFINKLLLSR